MRRLNLLRREVQSENPKSKSQNPNELQTPNWNCQLVGCDFGICSSGFGISLDFGIWILEFVRRRTLMFLNSNIPSGPLAQKWDKHKFDLKLVNPANKRKFDIIVVGTGLAGASAAASLAELGYKVKSFCFQDSPRRAHSIAAQGGINAAKNYPNDGDSVYRLFYDTIKGGDFRAREANVYRLAQISANIID